MTPSGPMAMAGGAEEFAADTEDLARFVDRGQTYLGRLEDLVQRLHWSRLAVATSIGHGLGPIDRVSSLFRELIAEVGLDTGMVAVIQESLVDYAGGPTPPSGLVETIERRLSGLGLAGLSTGADLVEDEARLDTFRLGRLTTAGLSTEAAAGFIDDSELTAAALLVLAHGADPNIVADALPGRLRRVANAADRGVVTAAEPLDALLDGGYDPSLARAILDGRLPPPDDDIRDGVVQAMLAGHHPGAGIDRAYFPAAYLRHQELSGQIVELKTRREEADGSSWSPWDGDRQALIRIDEDLERLGARRDRLAARFRIDSDGSVGRLDAVAAVAGTTAGSRWEGNVYGDAFNGYHETRISRGLLGGEAIREPEGYGIELKHMAGRVAADAAVAVAFYNRLGAWRAGDLVTMAIGNGLDRADLDQLGQGLAAASRSQGPDDRRLSFGGDELLGLPRPVTEPGVVGYSPALLFTVGGFGTEFLAQATAEALRLAQDGDHRGFTSHFAQTPTVAPGELAISYDGGVDPRNILLSRAAERPEVARSVIDHLLSGEGRIGPIPRPGESTLAPLLEPTIPFPPPTDRADPGPLARPQAVSLSPITAFLGAVGVDPEASRSILLAAAGGIEKRGPIVQDGATAAGLDLILAQQVTAVFEPAALAAVGIEASGLNEGAAVVVGPDDWRSIHGEILRHGRGQALASATDALVSQAIIGATDGAGRFHQSKTKPFAHLAARVEAETYQAAFAHSAQIDEAARRRNHKVSAGVSTAIGTIGLLPGADIIVGFLGWGAGAGWSWFFEGEDTENEIRDRRQEWLSRYYLKDPQRWDAEVASASLMARSVPDGEGTIDLALPGGDVETVPFRRRGETAASGFEWQDPRTGTWSVLPSPDIELHKELFPAYDPTLHRQVVSAATDLSEDYRDGVLAAAVRSPEFKDMLRRLEEETDGAATRADAAGLADATDDAGWTDRWVGR